MRNDDRALSLADAVLRAAKGADQAQVSVTISDASYARFARNYVTQNLESQQTTMALTYYIGKKSGTVHSADASSAGIARLVEQAKAIAQRVPPDNSFVSLPKPAALAAGVPSYFAATADASPDDRVEKLLPVFATMKKSNLVCSGFTTTQTETIAIANTLGVRVAYTGTSGGIQVKAIAPNTSGYAEGYALDYGAIDTAPIAERAAAKATVSREPADFAPGRYTVVLEPSAFQSAVKALLQGIDAQNVLDDKDSWMIGRIGKPTFSPNFTLRSDWSDPKLANPPFDPSDGTPVTRFAFVDKGVPTAYSASTYLSHKFNVPATGVSNSMIVDPGTKSYDELIASVDRGVLISRTWYERVGDPRQAAITGLTRDGVYLIENGKLTKALKNFRYFVSMVEVMKDVEFSNRAALAEPESDLGYQCVLPDAKIANFNLAAQTSFA
ncbi:MAG: TldD/PmbA family protein [Candidatus Eremiobacteraeota bacterium]|nr:TldD/PmbA family protein [Candidatus Eremiobacteraeota bacterium]